MTKAAEQRIFLDRLYERYHHLNIVELPMLPNQVRGLERLREVERALFHGNGTAAG